MPPTDLPTTLSLDESLARAETALAEFARGPAQDAADAVAQAFEKSGVRIARALVGAGFEGENAVRKLAKTVLEEIARAALARTSLGGGGASAQSALAAAAPVTLNMNFAAGADASGILRHQGQIAAQVARAVAYGSRNL